MKAVRFHAHGDSEVLAYEEAPQPVAAAAEVVVKVAATSFNPVDVAIRAGYLQEVFPVSFPHVPGIDVAGTIAEVGAAVTDWAVGDEVVAFLPMHTDGASAEYVAVAADLLAAAPRNVELADTAALPAVGLTAWQALFEHAGLIAGNSVLINGAGGAVGGYAVQLAARAAAVVTATASPRSADRVRADGAARIIDYTAIPLAQAVSGQRFDVVINLVATSPEETAALVDLVADGGIFVSTTTPGEPDPERGVRAERVFARSDATQLAGLVALVDAGDLRIDVAARRPLSELAAVHAEAVTGQSPGKTILLP
ncbi:NADP-dependent oxidoreductase [Nocardia sp. NPDC058705]|uniref:NADP-dependent oxidoreductase n=1 Tax=Nocardia sp. NPDC058705 TaxID=3346609 RepID=UPI0036B4A183